MSTILDALRKVEQDNQERSADARARLLSSPLRPYDYSVRQKHTSWLLGASLAVVGFLIGVGLMYTSLQPDQTNQANQINQINQINPGPSANQQAIPSALPDQAAAPFVPPPEQDTQSQTVAMVHRYRSPFVSAPPRVQPPPHQTTSRSDPDYVLEPLEPDFWPDSLPEYEQAEQRGQTLQAEPAEPAEPDAQFIAPSPAPTLTTPAALARPSQASLGLLQWSSESDKRFAFIKIGDGPLTMVYEGDSVGGFTVVTIRKDSVDLRSGGAHGDLLTLYSR